MKILLLLIAIGAAICAIIPTPKMILTRKVALHITGFLSDEQLSKAIDVVALGIHNGKGPEDIISDVHDYLLDALDEVQMKTVKHAYTALVKDLGEEGASNTIERIKKVLAYAIVPALDNVRAEGDTPDLAYFSMSRQLTQDFVKVLTSLVKDTLSPPEWNSVRTHYGTLLRTLDTLQQPCIPVTTITGVGVTSTANTASLSTGAPAFNPEPVSASASVTSPNLAVVPSNAISAESIVGSIPASIFLPGEVDEVMSDDITPLEDVEKTQEGREEDAERVVRANKFVWVAAEECFKKVGKFVENAAKELELIFQMELDEDLIASADNIEPKLEQCERRRESFALLSCDPIHFKEKVPQQQSTQTDESVDNTESAESVVPQTDFGVLGPSLVDKEASQKKSKEKKEQKVLPPKTPSKETLQLMPTPQSSIDENMTQLSEAALLPVKISSAEKEKEIGNAKKQAKILKSKTGSDKQNQSAKKEVAARSVGKITSNKPKPQPPTTPSTPKKSKRRWWQFW